MARDVLRMYACYRAAEITFEKASWWLAGMIQGLELAWAYSGSVQVNPGRVLILVLMSALEVVDCVRAGKRTRAC